MAGGPYLPLPNSPSPSPSPSPSQIDPGGASSAEKLQIDPGRLDGLLRAIRRVGVVRNGRRNEPCFSSAAVAQRVLMRGGGVGVWTRQRRRRAQA